MCSECSLQCSNLGYVKYVKCRSGSRCVAVYDECSSVRGMTKHGKEPEGRRRNLKAAEGTERPQLFIRNVKISLGHKGESSLEEDVYQFWGGGMRLTSAFQFHSLPFVLPLPSGSFPCLLRLL